ncbi:Protein polybromo-1 [Psilocybe cubensis]|uniref:Bromo domain-containing protein n=2 Tax=Psilocybe cubensis TaxID=181762 RepID=A0A8H7Y9B5_PSICU|nr:Protein polybromo-1 [Psilocybe cubensis]KAH9486301.1 Protein polybromo-1 [Psilocybe cubensis]
MSKRELEALNGLGDHDGSRHNKRRREAGGSSSDVDVTMSDPVVPAATNGGGSIGQVKEQGLKLWQTVKDATKDDIFLRKPSKRLYPDYYVIIKQPIALEDIKKALENNEYSSLEAVKNDFDLLFGNAKQYNLPESIIYQDAKELLKLVHKTYNKMVPKEEDGENNKPKPPSLNRLIKVRLEKLVAKTTSDGRVLSTEFMQLPSRKLWPIYYKEIKSPMAFDIVSKRIKQKEYQSSAAFAADVEKIFSNALAFNAEEAQIWHDAMTLRDYFRQLMSDLPPPHNLPEYTKPSNKIKIKPPHATQPTASSSHLPAQKQESAGLTLRVPAPHQHKASPKATTSTLPIPTPTPVPAPATAPTPAPTLPVAPVTAAKKVASPKISTPKTTTSQLPSSIKAPTPGKAPTPVPPIQQTISFVNATSSHYPRAPYAPPNATSVPSPVPTPLQPNAIRPTSAVSIAHSASQSPAPVVLPLSHQLKSINLRIQPSGRTLSLDHRDGVKGWALRLMPGETTVYVSNIMFMGDEEDEESSEEEEDDIDMDVDVESGSVSPKNGRKKGKGRGRGRPPKATTMAAKAAATKAAKDAKKKTVTKIGEVQLKLNKFAVKEQPDQTGEWSVYLPVGSNVIEVGETGGMVWKVYAERLGDV